VAHITPDSDAEGEPVVSNGVALCKLHHAAFDRSFFAIRPDYVIEVRPSVLLESDGPMLVVGLQQIHGQQIHLPRRSIDRPDKARLERRYEQFKQAAG
jgi:putative restriction endonuclease